MGRKDLATISVNSGPRKDYALRGHSRRCAGKCLTKIQMSPDTESPRSATGRLLGETERTLLYLLETGHDLEPPKPNGIDAPK